MEDVGMDFDAMLQTYEKLIYDLASSNIDNPDMQAMIKNRLPEGWLDWAETIYRKKEDKSNRFSRRVSRSCNCLRFAGIAGLALFHTKVVTYDVRGWRLLSVC